MRNGARQLVGSLGDLPAEVYPPDDLSIPAPAPRAEREQEKIPVYQNGKARQFTKVVTTAGFRALKSNDNRIGLEFFNIGTDIVRISYGTAAGATSIPIPAAAAGVAGYYSPPIAPTNDVYVIADANTPTLIIVEYSKSGASF